MTKPREKTREELTAEIEESKKKIRQFENREKIIKQKTAYEIRIRDWSSDVCSSDLFMGTQMSCNVKGIDGTGRVRLCLLYTSRCV